MFTHALLEPATGAVERSAESGFAVAAARARHAETILSTSITRELGRQHSTLLANVVRALVSAIDAKDPYTCGHSDRVARYAVCLALEMRCSPHLLNTIYTAGLLHDVGKIGIHEQVLRKPGRLTDEEYEHIKAHPELGYHIRADVKPLGEVLPAVLYHHEQWNGLGYPHGLAAEDIPRMARIIAVADAYDAMTSDRPYRSGMPTEEVDQIFRDGAGKHWDPEVIEAYLATQEDLKAIARHDRSRMHIARRSSMQTPDRATDGFRRVHANA